MAHICECDIQICCPETEMSTLERSSNADVSTKGQHNLNVAQRNVCHLSCRMTNNNKNNKIKLKNYNILIKALPKFANNRSLMCVIRRDDGWRMLSDTVSTINVTLFSRYCHITLQRVHSKHFNQKNLYYFAELV